MRALRRRFPQPMALLVSACLLLALLFGSYAAWNLWQHAQQITQEPGAITPPAAPHTGPLAAGTRFVFLRDGALWSVSGEGANDLARLTPEDVTVAPGWSVRPARPGKSAGNMVVYIDLRRGFMHTIRSDGQSDTVINTSLLPANATPADVWETSLGASLLGSLSWSADGNILAFLADPAGNGQPGLYLYQLDNKAVQQVALSGKGVITHLCWSPDSVRLAFQFTHDGKIDILDYNVQNRGLLTLPAGARTDEHVITLDWAPDLNQPAITWSLGADGHIHSIWQQRVGGEARLLVRGDYVQASYARQAASNHGSWLLVVARSNLSGDVLSLDLKGNLLRLSNDKQAAQARWSPDGTRVSYLDNLINGLGVLHVITLSTGSDTSVMAGVLSDPQPVWSPDGQRIAYCTSSQILLSSVQALKVAQPLKLAGPATVLSWSVSNPNQLVLALADGQAGIYLVDIQRDNTLRLDQKPMQGEIRWSLIP
jgi:Tol biopolymer transport system component